MLENKKIIYLREKKCKYSHITSEDKFLNCKHKMSLSIFAFVKYITNCIH